MKTKLSELGKKHRDLRKELLKELKEALTERFTTFFEQNKEAQSIRLVLEQDDYVMAIDAKEIDPDEKGPYSKLQRDVLSGCVFDLVEAFFVEHEVSMKRDGTLKVRSL